MHAADAGVGKEAHPVAGDGLRPAGSIALYLVDLECAALPAPEDDAAVCELAPGLYLVESAATPSRLYHAWKRRHAPTRLLFVRLFEAPKFKGMAPGALAWLRARAPALGGRRE